MARGPWVAEIANLSGLICRPNVVLLVHLCALRVLVSNESRIEIVSKGIAMPFLRKAKCSVGVLTIGFVLVLVCLLPLTMVGQNSGQSQSSNAPASADDVSALRQMVRDLAEQV